LVLVSCCSDFLPTVVPPTEGANTTTFQYDPNGSTTKKTLGATVTTHTWDGARRLRDVSLHRASQGSFAYRR
jgi:YD repeat-containing protein